MILPSDLVIVAVRLRPLHEVADATLMSGVRLLHRFLGLLLLQDFTLLLDFGFYQERIDVFPRTLDESLADILATDSSAVEQRNW